MSSVVEEFLKCLCTALGAPSSLVRDMTSIVEGALHNSSHTGLSDDASCSSHVWYDHMLSVLREISDHQIVVEPISHPGSPTRQSESRTPMSTRSRKAMPDVWELSSTIIQNNHSIILEEADVAWLRDLAKVSTELEGSLHAEKGIRVKLEEHTKKKRRDKMEHYQHALHEQEATTGTIRASVAALMDANGPSLYAHFKASYITMCEALLAALERPSDSPSGFGSFSNGTTTTLGCSQHSPTKFPSDIRAPDYFSGSMSNPRTASTDRGCVTGPTQSPDAQSGEYSRDVNPRCRLQLEPDALASRAVEEDASLSVSPAPSPSPFHPSPAWRHSMAAPFGRRRGTPQEVADHQQRRLSNALQGTNQEDTAAMDGADQNTVAATPAVAHTRQPTVVDLATLHVRETSEILQSLQVGEGLSTAAHRRGSEALSQQSSALRLVPSGRGLSPSEDDDTWFRFFCFDRLRSSVENIFIFLSLSVDHFRRMTRKLGHAYDPEMQKDLTRLNLYLTSTSVVRQRRDFHSIIKDVFLFRKKLELLRWKLNVVHEAQRKVEKHVRSKNAKKVDAWKAETAKREADVETWADTVFVSGAAEMFALYDALLAHIRLMLSALVRVLKGKTKKQQQQGGLSEEDVAADESGCYNSHQSLLDGQGDDEN